MSERNPPPIDLWSIDSPQRGELSEKRNTPPLRCSVAGLLRRVARDGHSGASFLGGVELLRTGGAAVSVNDAVVEYRMRLVRVIEEAPNKRLACRQAGIHPSTFYRWRKRVAGGDAAGGRRRVGPGRLRTESQVVAMALAHPNLGPRPVASELARMLGLELSGSTVWRILCEHRLNTRRRRWLLLQGVTPDEMLVRPAWNRPPGRIEADIPGDLVQMDCFHVGSFKETRLGAAKARRGTIWQYTAIDVASSFTWAQLHASAHNPDPARTSALAYQVAADLKAWGWDLTAVSTDNGNEFRAQQFGDTIRGVDATHRFIRAGRPQSNGKVERVHRTLLEEFYQPALINYVEPSITGLRRDLDAYINYYNHQRPHRGKWNNGQPPAAIIKPDTKLIP